MPRSPLFNRLRAQLEQVPQAGSADPEQTDSEACAWCQLGRDQHGVQLIHRYVPPGQPVVTW